MDLWVFGYGSLMWRPNFRYAEAHDALLEGGRRALCVYSVVHRGTHGAPGLVLGLDRGGICQGIAYRVPSIAARETRHYLKRRENVTNTYVAMTRPVKLIGRDREVMALCYMVNRAHPQYAGGLSVERQAQLVRRGRGASGRNIDYVVNTVDHLRRCGVYEPGLERLMTLLGFPHHRRR